MLWQQRKQPLPLKQQLQKQLPTLLRKRKLLQKKRLLLKPVVTKAETKVNFFVEYGGVQVSVDEVIKNVKATYGKDAKEISVYLKPEESKAYFVADGVAEEMDVYFC